MANPKDRGTEVAEALTRVAAESRLLLDELLSENAALKAENARLAAELETQRAHAQAVEKVSTEFEDRYLEIEKQNGNLASLYVATYNLHSTLDFTELLKLLREIVVNLLGSESFGVYARSARHDTQLELLAGEGIDLVAQRTLHTDGLVGEALTSRHVVFAKEHVNGQPLACVPLHLGDEILGAIVIYGLLSHKVRFEPTDHELLELLATQAAIAFYAARLHAQVGSHGTVRELFLLREHALAIATGGRTG